MPAECLGYVQDGDFLEDCYWRSPTQSRIQISQHIKFHEDKKQKPIIHRYK